MFHDVDGEGRVDLVVGDLMGRITVASRLDDGGPPRYGDETPRKTADGNDLEFHGAKPPPRSCARG